LTIVAAAPALWRMQKTVALSGHSLHPQKPSPVSIGFVPPVMADHIGFRPEALAAAMARTLTLRAAPPALLHHWIRSQLAEVEYLVADGAGFALSPDITSLADAERSAFAGRVGAGVTDVLMNALGYVWRDNGACLTGTTDPHADFIYAGGAVTGHGVVLAEAHGSFAQSVTGSRMSGEAKRKYRRQVKPHIAGICAHGKVIHGYAVAFGSNPTRRDTFLHVAETKIAKPRAAPKLPAPQTGPPGPGLVPTSLALAAHRANFLLMGASNVVAWIDWLRGGGERPDENAITTFFAVEIAGRRLLVAAEYLLPYLLPWVLLQEWEAPNLVWRRAAFERWRDWLGRGAENFFAMDEVAAKSFLLALSGLIGGGRDVIPPGLDLPDLEPAGLFASEPDRRDYERDARYPVVQFRDGLALLGRLPRSSPLDGRSWSPSRGFD
jgi:hypothetical protein